MSVEEDAGQETRAHGALTEPIAAALRSLAKDPNQFVYHDHAGSERRRIWAHMGQNLSRGSVLSGVDVLMADVGTGRALLVLEIEETGCPPKTLLGDILGVALSDYVSVEGGSQRYAITPETELWVCYVANPRGHQQARNERIPERLKGAWGQARPLPAIRLVAADTRDVLVEATVAELRRCFESDGISRDRAASAT